MLSGFMPNNISLGGVADWMMLAVGLTVGVSLAGAIFKPLEDTLKKGA
tara:strand:- start:91 stop:234 length:144 start_codon:yes stop_codon:yes gene_type:complete